MALIWEALEIGAEAAARTVGSKAVKTAYQGFKALLSKKLRDKSADKPSPNTSSKQSSAQRKRLKATLEKTGVHKDRDVVEAAQKLMKLVDPKNTATGKYNVQIEGGVQGFVQGNQAQVKMTFGAAPRNEKK